MPPPPPLPNEWNTTEWQHTHVLSCHWHIKHKNKTNKRKKAEAASSWWGHYNILCLWDVRMIIVMNTGQQLWTTQPYTRHSFFCCCFHSHTFFLLPTRVSCHRSEKKREKKEKQKRLLLLSIFIMNEWLFTCKSPRLINIERFLMQTIAKWNKRITLRCLRFEWSSGGDRVREERMRSTMLPLLMLFHGKRY